MKKVTEKRPFLGDCQGGARRLYSETTGINSAGNDYTRFSLATSVSWKEKGSPEYKTRPEWHRVICWSKLAE